MKKIPQLTLVSILTLAVLVVPTLLAAAKELAVLTVRGPGINGVLALNDAQGLLQLQQYGFFGTTTDTSTLANVPQNLGAGYTVTAYLNLDGNSVPFAQGIYYPAMAGEQGYIHFIAGFDGSAMKPTRVDRWAVVTPVAAAAFSRMLAAQGITLQLAIGASAVQLPLTVPAAPVLPSSLLTLALAGTAVLFLASIIWIQRRRATIQS